jgi:hypothetical protein
MILWPRKHEAKPLEPRIMVNPRLIKLETAKEILEKILLFYRYLSEDEKKFDQPSNHYPSNKKILCGGRDPRSSLPVNSNHSRNYLLSSLKKYAP